MYRLREMDVDDKVCEQVSMTMLSEVSPTEVMERCVQQSEPWSTKVRRVRLSTALSLVLFVIAMGLWSRRNQCQVWQSLVGKLSDIHPAGPKSTISDSGLSGRRKALGSHCVQALMRERCQVIAQRSSMPGAFFARYRLMAIDGTVFNTADTKANAQAGCRAAAINTGPGPIRRCAVCSWPSVAAMRWSGW
jgi:transposase IS4-like protein